MMWCSEGRCFPPLHWPKKSLRECWLSKISRKCLNKFLQIKISRKVVIIRGNGIFHSFIDLKRAFDFINWLTVPNFWKSQCVGLFPDMNILGSDCLSQVIISVSVHWSPQRLRCTAIIVSNFESPNYTRWEKFRFCLFCKSANFYSSCSPWKIAWCWVQKVIGISICVPSYSQWVTWAILQSQL